MSLQLTPDRHRALTRHAELSSRLAGLLIERGQVSSAAIKARATTIEAHQSQGVPITTARELAIAAAAKWEADAADLTGQIDALRAELRHLELTMGAI